MNELVMFAAFVSPAPAEFAAFPAPPVMVTAFAPPPKAAAPVVLPKATGGWDLVRIHAPGWHVHKCGACGAEWSHKETSYGSRSDHLCTACGKGPWWTPAATNTRLEMVQVVGPPVPTVKQSLTVQPAVTYTLPTFQSYGTANCPSGNCPTSYTPPLARLRLFR